MKELYCRPFIFWASRYEEYQNGGICTGKGETKLVVISNAEGNKVWFYIDGDIPTNMKRYFDLPIMGEEKGDILDDRIQYGRLQIQSNNPFLLYDIKDDPSKPEVCNIFRDKACIRFAMLSPLRIFELYGRFELMDSMQSMAKFYAFNLNKQRRIALGEI